MKLFGIIPLAPVVLTLIPVAPAVAQLTPDNSLGAESSVVTTLGQTGDRIDGGAPRGSNLFHRALSRERGTRAPSKCLLHRCLTSYKNNWVHLTFVI